MKKLIPKHQAGSNLFRTNKPAYVDSVLTANKNLDWVKRLRETNTPTLKTNTLKGFEGEPDSEASTHLMSDDGKGYVFPQIVRDSTLRFLGGEDPAYDYAKQTNTGIQLPQEQGTWFANNGYKTGTNVLKKLVVSKRQTGGALAKRFYNAIDPTALAPTFSPAGIKQGFQYVRDIARGYKAYDEVTDKVSDAAWRKRLDLPYNNKYLPKNPDGSVRMPLANEQQILLDTMALKKRMRVNAPKLKGQEPNEDYKADEDYLFKLRNMFNKGKTVGVEEGQAWKDRDTSTKDLTPLNVLGHFSMKYDKPTNTVKYSDIYDFDKLDWAVPGKPFNIKGKLKNPNK